MSNIIAKIKEKGLKKSIRMISVKLKKREKSDKKRVSSKKAQALKSVVNAEFDTIVIFENHFGYYNIMLQRPQHITRSLSDEKTLVLYNSYYDIDYKDDNRLTKLKDNFYILDMYYYRRAILDAVKNKDVKKVLMVYSTDTVPYARVQEYEQAGFKVLYEYVDDINPDLIAPSKLDMIISRHQTLINSPNSMVVATASKLYQNVLDINRNANVKLVSNGVECEKFPANVRTKDEEYRSWLKEETIKVGYYGALASWVDYGLLKHLISDSNIQLILIGVEHDSSLKESGILEAENVKYFGKKPYNKLAGYANCFDVCIIPFVVNDITEATSPVKLFEYMAMGKPVVTTALPECKKYEVVNIAESAEQFKEMIYDVAAKSKDSEYIEQLQKCALGNDWKAKAAEIKLFLTEEKADER